MSAAGLVFLVVAFLYLGSEIEGYGIFGKKKSSEPPKGKAYVEKVVDGDTIKVRVLNQGNKIHTIRITGIDCPESHKNKKCKRDGQQGRRGCDWQVPRGLEASRGAAKLLKHKTVTLECGGKCKKGGYGRHLRYVRLDDGSDYGLRMVRDGYCEDFGWKYPHPRDKTYKSTQKIAKAKGVGIWTPK